MTGNLNMMMKFRDLQVAEDVGKKAELGWFDVEFTMYGCAYMNEGKMFYKVSSEAQDIYDFIEASSQQGIYPSNILSFTEKCPVPSGMKQLIAQDVKVDLGKKLRDTFPQEFFEILYGLADEAVNNTAAELLWNEAEQLEGVFEEELLRYFEELVNYAYGCCHVNKYEYDKLMGWIAEERKNMDDDFISKDIFEKTMYGIAYEEDGQVKFMENAQRAYIYEKSYALEQEGVFVTPVFCQTFWYNYVYRLPDVIKDFKKKLRSQCDEAYRDKIKAIKHGGSAVSVERFNEVLAEVTEKFGDTAAETLVRYGYRWGILK